MNRLQWLSALLLVGCAGYGADEFTYSMCASEVQFAEHVSPLLERRCGTLDCHGVEARPLRLYGRLGLRFGDSLSGGTPTTAEETNRNWVASCGLEPELTHRVLMGEAWPDELMLLRKPLEVVEEEESLSGESHKGGAVLERGAADHRCLESWLRGIADAGACEEASTKIR